MTSCIKGLFGNVQNALQRIEQACGKDVRILFDDRMHDTVTYSIRQIRYNDAIQEHLQNYDRFTISAFLNGPCLGIDDGADYVTIRPAVVPGGYTGRRAVHGTAGIDHR